MARGIRCIKSESEDSEDNLDKENEPPLAMPPDDATAEELRDVSITLWCVIVWGLLTASNPQVLQASQLRERKLYEENIGQKWKIKSLEKSQVKRRWGTQTSEHDDEIKDIARKFAIMGEPWLDDTSFKQEWPGMSADSVERYQSVQRIEEGIIAELYDAVPTKLLGMLQNENHFKDVVSIIQLSR